MSIDYSIYVGPVVRCRFTPEKRKVQAGIHCPQHGARYGFGKFCAQCGSATSPQWREVMRAPMDSLCDLDDGFSFMVIPGDSKAPGNEHVYWVNMMAGAPRLFHLDDESDHFEPLAADTREKDLAWMIAQFPGDIERMRRIYGAENVTMDWGVFRWTS